MAEIQVDAAGKVAMDSRFCGRMRFLPCITLALACMPGCRAAKSGFDGYAVFYQYRTKMDDLLQDSAQDMMPAVIRIPMRT